MSPYRDNEFLAWKEEVNTILQAHRKQLNSIHGHSHTKLWLALGAFWVVLIVLGILYGLWINHFHNLTLPKIIKINNVKVDEWESVDGNEFCPELEFCEKFDGIGNTAKWHACRNEATTICEEHMRALLRK